MAKLEFVKFETLSLKDHPDYDEKWVQNIIAGDPSILGLGDLTLLNEELAQRGGGRLDLLFEDTENSQRYEVEIQLGKLDESHIIRTIEYWDIEKKRFPQYDHTAVIIAEDITSRFLNVVSLFNGFIPLIAIQMKALRCGDKVTLDFTTILDQMELGPITPPPPTTNRSYWEKRASKTTVSMADDLLAIVQSIDPVFEMNYNKYYIGLKQDGKANNFVHFGPKKKFLRIAIKLKRSQEVTDKIENGDLDLISYTKDGFYRIRLRKNDLTSHRDLLTELIKQSYDEVVA